MLVYNYWALPNQAFARQRRVTYTENQERGTKKWETGNGKLQK